MTIRPIYLILNPFYLHVGTRVGSGPKSRMFLLAGKSTDEAMNDYITKVKQLLEEAAACA